MKVSLNRGVFIRQYGPYTYITDTQRKIDRVYIHAEPFFNKLSKVPVEDVEIIDSLKETFPAINENVLRNDLVDVFLHLYQNGMISCSEKDYFEGIVDKNRELYKSTADIVPISNLFDDYFEQHPTILALQIEVTYNCNEHCIHCYIPRERTEMLPFEKVKSVIDEFSAQGGLILTISGGECLLHPDIIDILDYAHSKDLIIKVLSNLTLCNERIIVALKKVSAEVQTSLYSMNATIHDRITCKTGSFKSTKRTLEKLLKEKIRCTISCPIMHDNEDEFPAVYKFATENGMSAKMDFMIIAKMDGNTDNLGCRTSLCKVEALIKWASRVSLAKNKDYYATYSARTNNSTDWLNHHPCSACISRLCLGADGHYFPCPGFGGYVLGDCYTNTMEWVWTKSEKTLSIRSILGRDFTKCINCLNRDFCSLCLCRNFTETGDMFTPSDFNCEVARINHDIVNQHLAAGNSSIIQH